MERVKVKKLPSLYRVYKATVQRVPLNVKSLNSHAAFLIVSDSEKQVIGWIGSDCESTDTELVKEIGCAVMCKDYRLKDTTEIPVILEGDEPPQLLEAILDIFYSNSNTYFSKLTTSERKQKLTNSSVSVGLIEQISENPVAYDFQETAFAHPDNRGTVPRVTFVPIELKTIAYVNIGDQWDVWISRAVTEQEIQNVMIFLEEAISSQISLGSSAFKQELLSQYIQITRQGEERTLFRKPLKIFTDFEPPGKTAPRQDPTNKTTTNTGGANAIKSPLKINTGNDSIEKKTNNSKPTFIDTNKHASEEQKDKEYHDNIGTNIDAGDRNGNNNNNNNRNSTNRNSSNNNTQKDYVKFFAKDGNRLQSPDSYYAKKDGLDNDTMGFDMPTIDPEGEGVQLYFNDLRVITPAMLKIVEHANITPEQRRLVIEEGARNPASLIGWQVEIDEGIFSGVFVITETKKTIFHKSIHHLRALGDDEFWARLQRGPNKKGQKFRPLRKILSPDANGANNGYVSEFSADYHAQNQIETTGGGDYDNENNNQQQESYGYVNNKNSELNNMGVTANEQYDD